MDELTNNEIVLRGRIENVRPSHTIDDIEYYTATMVCKRETMAKDDVLDIIFKKLCYPFSDTDNTNDVTLIGNVRSYSERAGNKNNVSIYVFTYFDKPKEMYENETNHFKITGRICKMDDLYVSDRGKKSLHFILANNLVSKGIQTRLNNYLPCAAWGKLADKANTFKVGDIITVLGELHSREYKKVIDGELQLKVAHELYITDICTTPSEAKE